MKGIYTLVVLLISTVSWGQYAIGNTTITFIDGARGGRAVESHIYYPATSVGTGVAVANGQFPVVSIGHGFVMSYTTYQYLWEHLVPLGYIVVLPATETGLSPSHSDFGADLSYVIQALRQEGTTSTSLFFQHVTDKAAIIGHSMGGGASFLAASSDTSITTMISFAAAETTPSAISAANNIAIPTLTLAGDEDCVSPPATNQASMYTNLSDCKAYAVLLGGSHCQFANSSTACQFGELSCNRSNFMTRAAQHTAIKDLITPWLSAWLYQDYNDWLNFAALSTGTNPDYTLSLVCNSNAPTFTEKLTTEKWGIRIYPNPAKEYLQVTNLLNEKELTYQIVNVLGEQVVDGTLDGQQIAISQLEKGIYQLILKRGIEMESTTFIKD